MIFEPELRSLERQILQMGWVHPILISPRRTIIDGFHRWKLSLESPRFLARWHGRVPCVTLDVDDRVARILTVRTNRAKGVHQSDRMAELVKELAVEMEPEEIAAELGATKDEVALLLTPGVFVAKNLDSYRYGKAWIPVKNQNRKTD